MKRTVLLVLVMALLLTGCTNSPVPAESTPLPEPQAADGTNYNDYIITNGIYTVGAGNLYASAETETTQTVRFNRLYVVTGTQEPQVLCSDPACKHNTLDCSACFPTDGAFVSGSSIYYLNTSVRPVTLCKADLSGRNRQTVKVLEFPGQTESETGGTSLYCIINGNDVVISYGESRLEESWAALYHTTLEPDTPVIRLTEPGHIGFLLKKLADGKLLYYTSDLDTGEGQVVCLDLATGESRELPLDAVEAYTYVADYCLEPDAITWMNANQEGIFRYDLETEEVTLLRGTEPYEVGGMIFGDQYAYVINTNSYLDKRNLVPEDQRGLWIYDLDGNQLDFVSTADLGIYPTYVATTGDYVYFSAGMNGLMPSYCIRRAEIGTGHLELIPLG